MKNIFVPYLANDEIWKQAEAIRDKFGRNTIPVNVDIIAEKGFKLDFIPIPTLRSIVGAEAHISGDLTELHYEPDSSSFRLRFSIAHELGHAVLHPTQIKILRSGSYAEWKETIQELPSGIWGRAEYQAREFA